MNAPPLDEIEAVKRDADLLFGRAEIERAVDTMADAITTRLAHSNPLLLVTMTGGIVPSALLLARLNFPLQVDYIHLTRYGYATAGGALTWIKAPPAGVAGRTVLIIDDLLDHGLTLKAAVAECMHLGAAEALTAVLLIKEIENRPGLSTTDFYALTTPDRYLFGYGMDYKTYWRNGLGIYAVRGT